LEKHLYHYHRDHLEFQDSLEMVLFDQIDLILHHLHLRYNLVVDRVIHLDYLVGDLLEVCFLHHLFLRYHHYLRLHHQSLLHNRFHHLDYHLYLLQQMLLLKKLQENHLLNN
jgi:hypothetical protein